MTYTINSEYPLFVANRPIYTKEKLEVTDKYSNESVARVSLSDDALIDHAITKAHEACKEMRELSSYERYDILNHCVNKFIERSEELASLLCVEAGKPIKDSRVEVGRLIDTFKIAAEEATRIDGFVTPLDISPRAKGYFGQYKLVPVGPCSFITPFNFPLNLVAHKIAPAIAAGCPFILKPASLTPIGALVIGQILSETSLPEGAFSILPCGRKSAMRFVNDDRLKLLSFTGSASVGWSLKEKAGKKKVILELGGNAACIVDESTDVEDTASRVAYGAFYQSGQSCISVQRVLIQKELYSTFTEKFLKIVKTLPCGDPKLESTVIGPLISEKEAKRVKEWIDSAVKNGATLLLGGKAQGSYLEATVLEGVQHNEPIWNEEAFGPVVILESYTEYRDALSVVNDSRYGLQAGIFTQDLNKALLAWDELEVGGVIINEVPSWRVDSMPYGGVKDSGLGREGVRYSIREMMEPRLMVIRRDKKS